MNRGSKKCERTASRMKIVTNKIESRTPAALRAALLPKLLAGELRVPAAIGKLAEVNA